MKDDRRAQRIEEVHALLTGFAQQHLANAPELVGYTVKLWEQIGGKSRM